MNLVVVYFRLEYSNLYNIDFSSSFGAVKRFCNNIKIINKKSFKRKVCSIRSKNKFIAEKIKKNKD